MKDRALFASALRASADFTQFPFGIQCTGETSLGVWNFFLIAIRAALEDALDRTSIRMPSTASCTGSTEFAARMATSFDG
jgi:hypothetical protein